ncbi:transcriptional repressor [Halovulum dunhuangense]|uniref:Transcriptional repressor n=1 Tax=Halovulum dunhuangense TaxID=1505036 RepID=A0A849L4P4_9RHOB|nr:transcriptional repressor [Halovulum dunhuangense]NNU81162.1 transcriptional repressor [Halovulum dunhuangense]
MRHPDPAATTSPVAFRKHDHARCTRTALSAVEAACRARGLRLTPARARVMEILLEQHRAMGAYEILDRLRAEGMAAQPPVAYRALDFLVGNGFAHRIERLNAFIACVHPEADHDAAFMICRNCETVAEAPREAASGMLGDAARAAGFAIERTVVEAEGLCPACRETRP